MILHLFQVTFLLAGTVFGENFEEDDVPVVEGYGGTIKTAVEDDVLILTHENFDLQVMSKPIVLVEFYAPWCGHCRSLAPEYANAAKILKEEDPPIPLGKVDATIETDLAGRHEVTSYPTLFVFKNGIKYEYDGPVSAMGIVEYMKQQADPNWKPPPEAVLTLTNENFTETINNAEIILVKFYTTWCAHCKKLAPKYERAAQVLKDLPKPVLLAKVDSTEDNKLANKYEAQGWPTLMIFRKGRKYPYEGPRDESGIISYMKEQANPPSQEATIGRVLKNAIAKIDVTIIGYFNSETEQLYKEYIEAANFLRGKFSFFHTFNFKIAKHFDVTEEEIVLYQPEIYFTDYEPQKYRFTDVNGKADDIKQFIKEHVIPLVGKKTFKDYWLYQDIYPIVVVYYDVDFSFENRVQTQLVRTEVAKVAKDFKGKTRFAVANEDEFQQELVDLGLDDSGEDVNAAYFASEKVHYRMDPVDDFSADKLREFVESVQAGKVARHMKSQPVPKTNKGPLFTVVGSTFDQLVSEATTDVLIEFYAPWCGHCKKLEPIYKKLAKAFANDDRIAICRIDGNANDYPEHFDVKGFPTIYYIPASDKKNFIQYQGEKTLSGLQDFVNEQLRENRMKEEL